MHPRAPRSTSRAHPGSVLCRSGLHGSGIFRGSLHKYRILRIRNINCINFCKIHVIVLSFFFSVSFECLVSSYFFVFPSFTLCVWFGVVFDTFYTEFRHNRHDHSLSATLICFLYLQFVERLRCTRSVRACTISCFRSWCRQRL